MHRKTGAWASAAACIIAGVAIGAAASGMGNQHTRRKMKRQAEAAMHTVGEFAKDLSELIKK